METNRTRPDDSDHGSRADPAALLAAVTRLDDTLRTAEALVRARRRIDLAGLDGQIDALCQAALTLPPGPATDLRASLHALLTRTELLHAALCAAAPA